MKGEMDGQLTIFDVLSKPVDIRGICDDGYCPNCGSPLDDLEPVCTECGQLLDWERWKELNE